MSGLILFIAGLLLAIFSHPKIMGFVMTRLFNEGIVTQRKVQPEKAEIIKFAGPNLSLFFVGIIVMLLGILIRDP